MDSMNSRDDAPAVPEQKELPVDAMAATATPTATPGLWLRQAREQAGLTEEQVAKDLFLDTQVIRALEADRYKDIGAPVYTRGYLRRYAKLLGVDEAAVIERYEAMQGTPRIADPVPVSHNKIPAPRRALPAWAWWVIALALVIAAAITLLNGRGALAPEIISAVSTSVPETLPASSDTPLAAAASAAGTVDQTGDASRVASADATGTAPAATAEGMVSVQFQFAADSWVEIYDANQKSVLYEMGVRGTNRTVNGLPPLRVTLGSAAGVQVVVNGSAVPVPAANIQANVARFNINADGHIE